MTGFWNAVLTHIEKNWEAYSAAASLVGLGAISNMPHNRPKTLDDLWTWLRGTLQTASPTRAGTPLPPQPSDPTQAALGPQKEVK
jgi:hypothetical protein